MEKVFVKSGLVVGDLSYKIYDDVIDDMKFHETRFRQIIPPSREIHTNCLIDSYKRITNKTFSEVGHETHNMR